jgi:uncharacterized protein GlcG (DUF336 family)
MKRAIVAVHGALMMTALGGSLASAQPGGAARCPGLPTHAELKAALVAAVSAETSGLNNHMWATIVNRDGIVCAIAFSGADRSSQWSVSRVISAQKANTAAALALDSGSSSNGSGQATGLALSTANLYSAVQPGGSLYGLQHSNPVDTGAAYQGPAARFGTPTDPLVGRAVGGINVFGGGLGLYNAAKKAVGGIGASGDTSCADHNIAWRVRHLLKLDNLAGVGGVSGDTTRPDNIVLDIAANAAGGTGNSKGGFGHPSCPNTSGSDALPVVR